MVRSKVTKLANTKKQEKIKPAKLGKIQKFTLFFFHRPRKTALLCMVIVLFGALSYTTLLKREGFPAIVTPYAMSQGTYLVNDPAKVDADISKPLSEYLLKQDGVKTVQTQSAANFYTAVVIYNEDVNATERSKQLQTKITEDGILPKQATGQLDALKFGFTQRGDDVVVSFYAKDNSASTQELAVKAQKASDFFAKENLSLVKKVSIINPFETATNPVTGASEIAQKSFERYGERDGGQTKFYNSVVIGFETKEGADNIKLAEQIETATAKLNAKSEFKDYTAVVSASYAPQIKQQISELQKSLLEGLIAVLVVGSIVIAIRASFITVLAMFTVITASIGLLFLFGYSLNTITLFALILGLSLIVDDTIIMVEAIDAQRKKRKNPDEVVAVATGKVAKAMITATSTAALSFAPLLFVGGILGSFIRAIPVTIITALVTSLFVALVFIPFFARSLLLGKKHMGEDNVHEASAGVEAKIARFISAPMLWAKHSTKKLFLVGFTALIIGFGFIGAGGYLFQKVTFNIFPPSKDTNQLSVALTFPSGTTIEQAEQITDRANTLIAKVIGDNFVSGAYDGQADARSATLSLNLIDYNKRDERAPEIVEKLSKAFKSFDGAEAQIGSIDAGPPASDFTARVNASENRPAAIKLANDIASFLDNAKLERLDKSKITIENTDVSNTGILTRDDNLPYVEVTAAFKDTDTTTLVTAAKTAVEKEFTESKIASYGLAKDALTFDFGQEDENQDSFKALALAFPALLFVIYLLLAFQFRSFLQPLLIFMAIPFSLFGITLGLYLTDNAFSFFAMLGFFALIGLSLKNTILLTDYANQARRAGMHAVDAAHEALAERFRPLIATSLTAVVSLIPLALSSPFWEGLAVVLIFGLLSSTFLVVLIFPYYYLGGEYLRAKFSEIVGRRVRRLFKKGSRA